jgi:hypothetical protein
MPARPDPELGLRLAKAVADLYGDATASLLRLVARRLGDGIEDAGWAERKLAQLDQLRREALAEVERLHNLLDPAVETAVKGGADAGAREAIRDLASIDVRIEFVGSQRRAIEALVGETVSTVSKTHLRLLRSTLDAYREAIAEASAPQVLAGVASRRAASQLALNRFAARGITGFVDSAGRAWEIESYAEMATRTAVGRAQVQGALDRFDEAGYDLVIVSDAGGECELCRPWEGEVLSQSGNDTRYPSVDAAAAAGLFHNNCRHALGLFVEGLTKPLTDTADPAGDRARQQQRYLERGVRRWKRVEAAALDSQAAQSARGKARQWQARLREHVNANDLKRLPARERIGSAR